MADLLYIPLHVREREAAHGFGIRERIIMSENHELQPTAEQYAAGARRKHPLSGEERRELFGIGNQLAWALEEIGFDRGEALNRVSGFSDNVSLIDIPENANPALFPNRAITGGRVARIYMASGATLQTPQVRSTVFHEASHMLTQLTILGTDEYHPDAGIRMHRGLDRNVATNAEVHRFGVFTEGLADLFSLFAQNEPSVRIETGYVRPVAFMVAFLEEYGRRLSTQYGRDISTRDAFKRVMYAHLTQDYGFYRELVGLFGTEMVRFMNNVEVGESVFMYSTSALLGGFEGRYQELRGRLEKNQGIKVEGIPGEII